jgi:hypothetical protein
MRGADHHGPFGIKILIPNGPGPMDETRGRGEEVVTLHTTEQMVAAQRIYRSLGFQRDRSGDVEVHADLVLQAFRLPLPRPGGARCRAGTPR